jgi:hypothetical protein
MAVCKANDNGDLVLQRSSLCELVLMGESWFPHLNSQLFVGRNLFVIWCKASPLPTAHVTHKIWCTCAGHIWTIHSVAMTVTHRTIIYLGHPSNTL